MFVAILLELMAEPVEARERLLEIIGFVGGVECGRLLLRQPAAFAILSSSAFSAGIKDEAAKKYREKERGRGGAEKGRLYS